MGTVTRAFAIGVVSSLTFCGTLIAAYAQQKPESDWVLIAQNSDDTKFYSGKRGSYELATTRGGTQIAVILGQTEDKKSKNVTYGQWYVTTSDCEAGLGKLVILKLSGEYEMEADYISKGKNIASAIGDVICGIYLSNKKKQESKGM